VRRILDRFDGFEHVGRWARRIADRPATRRAYAIGAAINTTPTITEESKALLLGATGKEAA
jgi:GST-like protein